MDVSNFSSIPPKETGKTLSKRLGINNPVKASVLRRNLTHLKESLLKNNSQNAASSFEASTKLALIEAYIDSGKFFAAEQVLKEISKITNQDFKASTTEILDDSYVKDNVANDLRTKEITKDTAQNESLEKADFDQNVIAFLSDNNGEGIEKLRHELNVEVDAKVANTVLALKDVLDKLYKVEEHSPSTQ